jgi:hypothetical protein
MPNGLIGDGAVGDVVLSRDGVRWRVEQVLPDGSRLLVSPWGQYRVAPGWQPAEFPPCTTVGEAIELLGRHFT